MRSMIKLSCLALSAVFVLVGCGDYDPGEELENGALDEDLLDEEEEVAEAESELVAWCDDIINWNAGWVTFEDQVLTLVNQKRAAGATCGGVAKPPVAALTFDDRLRCAARKHSKDMGSNN